MALSIILISTSINISLFMNPTYKMVYYAKITGKNVLVDKNFNHIKAFNTVNNLPDFAKDYIFIFKKEKPVYINVDKKDYLLVGRYNYFPEFIKIVNKNYDSFVLMHEIGHAYWRKLSESDKEWWIEQWKKEEKHLFDYSVRSAEEDFSNDFAAYYIKEYKPSILEQLGKEKIRLITKNVER